MTKDVLRISISAADAAAEEKIAQAYRPADSASRQKALDEIAALQKQLDQLKAEHAQAKKPPAARSGKARHVAHAEGWKAVTTQPDLCIVGNAVVAFDSCATLDNKHTASPNVIARGTPVYRQGDLFKVVQGDAGSNIVSGTSQGSGFVKVIEGHNNVKVNGIPVARHDSQCMINCNGAGAGGALGKLVTEQKTVAPAAGGATNPDAPPGERTSERLERLKAAKAKIEAGQLDFNALDEYVNFKGSNQALDELIGRIKGTPGTAGDYAAQVTRGLLGFGKDFVMGVGELAYEGIKGVPKLLRMGYTSEGEAISQLNGMILAENIKLGNITAGTVGQGALNIGKALVKPVTDPWDKGQYVAAVTRGTAEVGTLAIGALKGVNAAKAQKLAEAEKAAGAVDDGVHVIFRGKIKYRTAKDANEELLDRHRAGKDSLPFKDGTMVAERELVPGERFKMSMGDSDLEKLMNPKDPGGVGGWGTRDAFTSQSEAMNKMAIRPEWKPNGIPNTVEFEVVKPFRTLDGIAGPQGSLSGGAQQFFLDLPRNGAKEYLRVVNVTTLPK